MGDICKDVIFGCRDVIHMTKLRLATIVSILSSNSITLYFLVHKFLTSYMHLNSNPHIIENISVSISLIHQMILRNPPCTLLFLTYKPLINYI